MAQVEIEKAENPLCIRDHNWVKELQVFDHNQLTEQALQGLRHAFIQTHLINGRLVESVKSVADWHRIDRVSFAERGLLIALIWYFDGEPQQARAFILPEFVEPAIETTTIDETLDLSEELKKAAILKEKQLVAKAVSGDVESFGKLYELKVDRVYRHIYYLVGNPQDAEDLTSKVFINALGAVGRYKEMGRPFIVWLLTIANNLIIDLHRARKNQVYLGDNPLEHDETIDIQDKTIDIQSEIEQLLEKERLLKAIKQLRPDRQKVITLRFLENLAYFEIAAIMQKKEGAIRVIQHRAIIELRGILESADFD